MVALFADLLIRPLYISPIKKALVLSWSSPDIWGIRENVALSDPQLLRKTLEVIKATGLDNVLKTFAKTTFLSFQKEEEIWRPKEIC